MPRMSARSRRSPCNRCARAANSSRARRPGACSEPARASQHAGYHLAFALYWALWGVAFPVAVGRALVNATSEELRGGTAAFMGGAALIGLGYGWVAYHQRSIRWTCLAHVLVDAMGIASAVEAIG